MIRASRGPRALAAWALALLACGAADEPAAPAAAALAAEADAILAAERARLQALGYVEGSSEPADPSRSGVTIHDAARVQPGYRLYSADTACEADLIDLEGEVVKRWSAPPCSKWSHAQLLADGSLLVPGQPEWDPARPTPSYLLRLRWDGGLAWRLPIHAHHDAAPRPDGSLLALVLQEFPDAEVFPDGVVIDNPIQVVSARGRPGRRISLHEKLKARTGTDACPFVAPVPSQADPGKAEPLHMNSIQWLDTPPPRVLLSTRHQDCVYLVDWRSREVLWAWGQGELDGPHDATWLENGHVLVFDNGMLRGWSRVVEVDPETDAIVWEYPGESGEPFYTRGRGGSQRLPNGNTLIAESNEGRAFEVTRSGEIVWEFRNPRIVDQRRRAIIRMRHYDAAFIEPLLGGED